MIKQVAAAIDFGTSKVACLVGDKYGDGRVDIIGAGTCSYAGHRHGEWVEPNRLEKSVYTAVREAEIQSRRRVKDVYIGIPGENISVICGKANTQVSSRDGKITGGDVQKLLQEAEMFYSADRYCVVNRNPVYYSLDNRDKVINPAGMRSSELTAHISYVLGDRLFMDDVNSLMHELGMNCVGYIATPLAQGMTLIPSEERDKTAVLIDVGYASSDVAIFEGDGIVFHESLPVGGYHIANDLSYGFDIPIEDAEHLKRRFVFGMAAPATMGAMTLIGENNRTRRFDMERIQLIIEARAEEMAFWYKESLLNSGYRLGDRSSVYLTGGGLAPMRGVRQFLAAAMGRNVKITQPVTPMLTGHTYSGVASILTYAGKSSQDEDEPRYGGEGLSFFRRLFGG